MPKFTIIKRPNGDYQFNLKTQNDHIILTSPGYHSKPACRNGIELVRSNAPDDARYERKISLNGKYFHLIASDGQVIATSEMYETTAGRDNGIEAVKSNALQAGIEEAD